MTNIHNGTFIGGNVHNTVRNGESGINILHRASAPEAFHDAADSHDQPRCHPETRIEMQQRLLNWCLGQCKDPGEAGSTVLWVHGPAGAGKSAIMATLAHRLEDERRLGGAFFFKRGHATRGNAKALFATIALQLAVNSAQLKHMISQTVEENPTIVERSISVQLRELILKPCSSLEDSTWTVLIDGLDECEGQSVQQEILRLILDFTRKQIPLRFIIASRPEAHICDILDDPSSYGLYRPFDVEHSFAEVRTYLVAEFARIHREHQTMAAVPGPWPSTHTVEHLVAKSSGYFIYASTVIRFVDDRNFRPTQRLAALEHLAGTGFDSPFDALDELYTQILSTVPKHYPLIPILRVIDNITADVQPPQIDTLLRLLPGDTELCLRPLPSLIEAGNRGIRFVHASFSDFLHQPSRAGDFHTGDLPGLVDLLRLILTELGYNYEDPTRNRNGSVSFHLDSSLGSLLPQLEHSQELIQLLSAVNFDFIVSFDFDVASWLKGAQPPPNESIHRWEAHRFSMAWASSSMSAREQGTVVD
ncbi:hypothetical protein DFH06DRAFT_722148 [Mycena polygramma]|nr:hypothetical protein DFH06DRAFT_722148 [Mycena polygramma]